MAILLCPPNTTNDQNNYSAPVPFIGAYVAGASMVCFLLLLFDIISGIRSRKRWLPCKYFSLNSATLSLLAIAAKLPVDLTSSMPSAYDQLSKLTGNAFVCVSMCFLMLSLASSSASVCLTNTIALTILVVTLVVNTCIQMSTGVIFSFILEHAIIMFFMLGMVILSCYYTLTLNVHKPFLMEQMKQLVANTEGSMLHRLKLCYLHGFSSEPQFALGVSGFGPMVASIACFACLIVVLEVTFKSFIAHDVKFCNGHSDYGWSIRIIVLTQILFILLASIAASYRWSPIATTSTVDGAFIYTNTDFENILSRMIHTPFLKVDRGDILLFVFWSAISFLFIIFGVFMFLPVMAVLILMGLIVFVLRLLRGCFKFKHVELEGIQEYKDLAREYGLKFGEWALTKCVETIKRFTSGSEKRTSLSNVKELLSNKPPSHQSVEQLKGLYGFKQGNEISCLYLVFLERVASVSTQSSFCDDLTQSLGEVFDIIHFIDRKINSSSFNSRKKCMIAKALWMGKGFDKVVSESVDGSGNEHGHFQGELPDFIKEEVHFIMNLINGRVHTALEELCDYMKQLFVDMLHIFLAQLPAAILKEVTECDIEECETKIRPMLQFVFQMKSLEGIVQWSFPAESNITSLTTSHASLADQRNMETTGHNDSYVIEEHHNVQCDEIIQVE